MQRRISVSFTDINGVDKIMNTYQYDKIHNSYSPQFIGLETETRHYHFNEKRFVAGFLYQIYLI